MSNPQPAPPEPDDPTPVRSAIVDDLDQGFVLLYDTYRRVVFSTALRVSGRRSDAEDLTAEAFLRAYRALRTYDQDRISGLRPRTWLISILLNTWRNTLRTASRQPRTAPMEHAPEVSDPGEDVQRQVERQETGRELAALLADLPEAQRIAVVLRHVSDLPVAEIALVLGRPEGTVKSDISRGLRRLRELTDGQEVY